MKSVHRVPRAAAGLLSLVLAGSVSAQCPEVFTLSASDANGYEQNGYSVCMRNGLIVMGAVYESVNATYDGAAYVYRWDGTNWNEEAKLVASDGAAYDYFGSAVATDGTRIVVGAPAADALGTDSGAVYVYTQSGGNWVEEVKLTASTGGGGDQFGTSVALEGAVAVVGSPYDDVGGYDQGAAYVFRRHNIFGWGEEQRLTLAAAANSDLFGARVTLRGTTAVVAAPLRDALAYNSGSIHVFRYGGTAWTEGEALMPADGAYNDQFGLGLSFDGTTIVGGAPYHDTAAQVDAGKAYVFTAPGGTYAELQGLESPAPVAYEHYGATVGNSAVAIVVGVPDHSTPTYSSGCVYSYTTHKGAWAYDQKHGHSTGAGYDYVGHSVSVEGNRALVGAPTGDTAYYDVGLGLIFTVAEFDLTVTPAAVNPGDLMTFDMFCGTPLSPCLFCVTDIGGAPYFQVLFKLAFSANHHLKVSAPTPPGLSGLDIGFMAFRFEAFGRIQASNGARVTFL